VDVATHAVPSFALARGFFPRHSWPFAVGVILAGTLADLDLLTLLFGPQAFLSGHYTVTHSLIGTVAVVCIALMFVKVLSSRDGQFQKTAPNHKPGFAALLLATSLAAIMHVLMDLATSSGVALLWPFRASRFAWDFLPFLDPWLLALLVMGIALPELLALVGSEIGVKEKGPRGRNGARFALAVAVLYIGARAILHGGAVAQIDAHSYRGESPHKVAAFPDSLSFVTWHGVVETDSQICTVDVPVAGTAHFDAETALCAHKPEESEALTAAQKTPTAQEFLQAASFPKASVNPMESGSEVVLRDLRDIVQNEVAHALAARIRVAPRGQVTSQNIVWARNVRLR